MSPISKRMMLVSILISYFSHSKPKNNYSNNMIQKSVILGQNSQSEDNDKKQTGPLLYCVKVLTHDLQKNHFALAVPLFC